jgi:hypothetical protein
LFFKFQVVEYFLWKQKSILPTSSVHTCIQKHAILFPKLFFLPLSEREPSHRREMLKALHSVSLRWYFLARSQCKIKRSRYSYLQLRLNNLMLHISYSSQAYNVKRTGSLESPSVSRHCANHELICK